MKKTSEKEKAALDKGDFNRATSEAWKLLKLTFEKDDFSQNELNDIGEIFENNYPVKLRIRNAKRNKDIAVKFFEDNIEYFKDFCSKAGFEKHDGTIGGPQREKVLDYRYPPTVNSSPDE
ncbi:hypothetical protein TVAG_501280 [Trichomonas vaginalis G3]|uniref:Uncharacterized protein n=2 Tax=Trichomonas vaginalis (strain ATCC PRA-98 / G3) TaxID=412133 RepID=A2GDE3_TRIV3|nr:hypothetical protein TVAG_501280 [Trichomonas vaginalis G3]|eukprot:XP_001297754.1 hypothetical protein [Trichomonas vaginalis G3]